eukprot:TRINITY_DN7568_c0_g1_i3.p1 TRINITY_DN7568_c0_g1~~TRINITY_DN7568_c0_g1_i3.p1  ORF type:complete len:407 (+),score=83.09 TRINITY_DN7568_c0_g1_i3:3-1223(+)
MDHEKEKITLGAEITGFRSPPIKMKVHTRDVSKTPSLNDRDRSHLEVPQITVTRDRSNSDPGHDRSLAIPISQQVSRVSSDLRRHDHTCNVKNCEELKESMSTISSHFKHPGFRDDNRYLATEEFFITHQLFDQQRVWDKVAIPKKRQECALNLKFLIRKGVPDHFRGQVWSTSTGASEFNHKNPDYYPEVLKNVFGSRIPTAIAKIPEFGGKLRPDDHFLTPAGIETGRRILCVIGMEHTDLSYVPVINDAVCLLLHFLTEADTYVIMNQMLEYMKTTSGSNVQYFTPGRNNIQLFLHTFDSIIKKRSKTLFSHMQKLGIDCHSFADEWFLRLFVGSFPFQTVLRIFDAFLNEGSKILYRVALAFMKLHKDKLLASNDSADFIGILQRESSICFDSDGLMKVFST